MTSSPKGFPVEGRLDDNAKSNLRNLKQKHSTVVPKGNNRRGLDVIGGGFFDVSPLVVVEVGSDASTIVLTGHLAKVGDLIRPKVTANSIEEYELFVDEVIDANTFTLVSPASADFVAGDTFDILRYVLPKLGSDGESLASVISPPIQFLKDSVVTTVTEDTVTPANNEPLPVKITSATGDINITAGDLHVQLSHSGATPDSTQIGDGTNVVRVKADGGDPGYGEAKVSDALTQTNIGDIAEAVAPTDTSNSGLNGLFKRLLQRVTVLLDSMVNEADVVVPATDDLTPIAGSDGTNYRALSTDAAGQAKVVIASSALPTGSATAAKQDDIIAAIGVTNALDFATETTLASIDTKVATETTVAAINTKVATETTLASLEAKDFATETTLATIAGLDFSTETTLAAQSAKLPASLGAKVVADSLSVTLATDATLPSDALTPTAFGSLDMAGTPVASGGYTELVSDTGVTIARKFQLFMSNGTPMYLAVGSLGSEIDTLIVPPGGFSGMLMELTLPANSRLSLKTLTGTANSGQVLINLLG